ncbi:ribonuclease E inhibitor RraA/Dimethylmenaquinone methyltransferase [Obelidium mucronatum]|nr:ribonuclease E inhibitor RraA/Dimethylmenaquinone methyltransferase [Obelidium mucronatum]
MTEWLNDIPTCDLADAMVRLKLGTRFLLNAQVVSPRASSPLQPSVRLVGEAHVASYAHASDPTVASTVNPIDSLQKGQVLVIAGVSGNPNAYFGGLLCARAVAIGAVGAVIDGRVRDLNEVWESERVFPVIATTLAGSVLGAAGYAKCVQVGGTVTLCRDSEYPLVVNEGDYIVADIDGCVCVPRGRVEEVASLARKIQAQDVQCKVDIVENQMSLVDAFKKNRS